MANRWGNHGNCDRLYFFGLQNHCRWWLQPWNEKMLAPWKKSYDKPTQHIKKQRHYFANKGLSSQSLSMFFLVVMYGCESWTIKKAEHQKNGCFWTVVLEKTLENPLDCKEIQPVHPRRSGLDVHWKDWCWSWNSNTLATWCEELTHWKRLWCWEGLGAGEEGDNRGWDGWMASLTRWTWVWVNSGSWWWTGRPGMLWFMGSQRVGHNWATELNWNLNWPKLF